MAAASGSSALGTVAAGAGSSSGASGAAASDMDSDVELYETILPKEKLDELVNHFVSKLILKKYVVESAQHMLSGSFAITILLRDLGLVLQLAKKSNAKHVKDESIIGDLVHKWQMSRMLKRPAMMVGVILPKKNEYFRCLVLPHRGIDLHTMLEKSVDSRPPMHALFLHILRAVKELHDKNIIHRDLKIENMAVNIGEEGQITGVDYLDLGHAVTLPEGATDMKSKKLVGNWQTRPLDYTKLAALVFGCDCNPKLEAVIYDGINRDRELYEPFLKEKYLLSWAYDSTSQPIRYSFFSDELAVYRMCNMILAQHQEDINRLPASHMGIKKSLQQDHDLANELLEQFRLKINREQSDLRQLPVRVLPELLHEVDAAAFRGAESTVSCKLKGAKDISVRLTPELKPGRIALALAKRIAELKKLAEKDGETEVDAGVDAEARGWDNLVVLLKGVLEEPESAAGYGCGS